MKTFIEENLKLIDEIHYRPILIVADNPNNSDDLYYGIEGNNVNVDKLYQMFVSITADLYQKGKITAQDVDKLKSSINESILLINNENIK
jgi:hypothetical protein